MALLLTTRRTIVNVPLGFLEKNRDTFSQDLMKLLQETTSKFLRNLFASEAQIGTETRKRAPSLGTQFKKSLDSLMSILSACQPFFVRCIKPNEYKAPNVSRFVFFHHSCDWLSVEFRPRVGLPTVALLRYDGNDQHSTKRLPHPTSLPRFCRSVSTVGVRSRSVPS